MNDLAKTKEESKGCEISPCCPDQPEYPSLCLHGSQVASFLDGQRVEPGKSYEVTIQFKVDGWNDRYGKSLDLCVLSSDKLSEVGDAPDEEEEEAAESIVGGYKA